MLRFKLVCIGVAAVLLAFTTTVLAKDIRYKLAPYLSRTCKKNDPKLNQCIVDVGSSAIKDIVKGDPMYRVPVLDPLQLQQLRIKQGTKQVGMEFDCLDCQIIGLKNIQFLNSLMDFEKKHTKWDFIVDKLKVVGKYRVSGKVLLLPINGDGDAEFTFENVKVSFITNFEYEERHGEKFWKLKNHSLPFEVDHLSIKLDNLFNGDKLLGDNMNKFLNDNWKELLNELGPGLSETIGQLITDIINHIAAIVPDSVLFPEK